MPKGIIEKLKEEDELVRPVEQLFERMQIGDSFFLPLGEDGKRIRQLKLIAAQREKVMKVRFMIEPVIEDMQKGVRCWCVESLGELCSRAVIDHDMPVSMDGIKQPLKAVSRALQSVGRSGVTERDMGRMAAFRKLRPVERQTLLEMLIRGGQVEFVNVNEGKGVRRRDAYRWIGE